MCSRKQIFQQRDKYQGDYTQKYYPAHDSETFYQEMFYPQKGLKSMIVLNREEYMQIHDDSSKQINLLFAKGGAIMAGSIAFIALYNKIPLVKKIQGRWIRKILKIGVLFLPLKSESLFFSVFLYLSTTLEHYQRLESLYREYKQNGDILNLCPNIRLSEK